MAIGVIEGGSEDEREKWTRQIIKHIKALDGVKDAGVNDFANNRHLTSLYIVLEAEEETVYATPDFKKGSRERKRTGYDIEPSLSSMTRQIKTLLEDNKNVTDIRSIDTPDPIYDHQRARNPTESNTKKSTGVHRRNQYIVDIYFR